MGHRRGTCSSLWPVAALGMLLIGCAGAADDRNVTATSSIPQSAAIPRPVAAAPAPRAAPSASARRSFAQATGPEWSGESGSSGHPLMSADAIRRLRPRFPAMPAGALSGGVEARHSEAGLRFLDPRSDARSEDHGSGGRAAGVHARVLGLSRPAGRRGAHPARTRNPRREPRGLRCDGEATTASTAMSSPRSGASSRNIRP